MIAFMLLWPWLLTPARNTKNLRLGQELVKPGFSEEWPTPARGTLGLWGARFHLPRTGHTGKLWTLQGLSGTAGCSPGTCCLQAFRLDAQSCTRP